MSGPAPRPESPASGAQAGGAHAVPAVPVHAPLGQGVLVGAQLIAPVLTGVRPVELVVIDRHRVAVLLDDLPLTAGHQLLLQELLLLGGRLELDALTVGEELAEEGVLTLELALGHDAGLLDQRGALRLETLEQPLGEVRVLEGVAAPTERVHLLLELQ